MSQRNSRLVGGVYQLGQVISSGGMLSSYTAYNRNTGDVVGLTIIESPPVTDAQMLQQLLQPLEQRRSIASPNVIRVYDWGLEGSRIYIATDPPRGITLRHVLDSENVDLQRCIDLLRQMTQGLKALHEHGVAGIDLRPQLITIDVVAVTDRVQLDDIGLRSLLKALGYVNSQRPDDIGFLDPRYAPPEYINGGQPGPWSDIYQLGILLFEMVTGRVPFVGRNSAETGVLQSTEPVPRMIQYKHDTPAPLQDLLECAMAKNPGVRFANTDVLLTALASIQLPTRRSTSAEWSREGGAPTSPNQGLTDEIQPVEKNISQSAILLGGQPPSARAPLDMGQQTLETSNAYAFLCYEQDGVEVQRFALTKKDVVVGRNDPKRGLTPDVDLTPADLKMTVSRQHARIRYEGTFFYIEDLKSRNKTRLGELPLVPLKPELLQHGDIIQFGSVR
ncbi:MAG: FHA domain-containing serine/threonine-protein kinase, partial [Ktedonobacteraceae bacterium]